MNYLDTGYFITHMQTAIGEHFGNYKGGKFKLDEMVKYVGDKFPQFKNQAFRVTSISLSAEDVDSGEEMIEYSLAEFPFLVWEFELEKL